MQSAKEKASNITASAKAGMEKTKATVQEKAERMTARDPLQKEMATEKKEERIHEAERQKHEDREHNAATRHAAAAGGGTFGHDYTTAGGGALGRDYTATTGGDYSTGTTGADYTAEGGVRSDYPQGTTADVVGSQYPTAQTTGGAGRVGRQDPNARTGYGTGRTY